MKTTLLKKQMLPLLFMVLCVGSLNAASGNMTIGNTTVPDLGQNASGTGWTWNASTGTISLTNTYTGEAIAVNCQSADVINLVYTGNISISSATQDGIYCNGALTINGSGGTLSSAYTGENYMFSAITSMRLLTISSGTVYASCAALGTESQNASAVYADRGFKITGSANVTTNVTSAYTHGFFSLNDSDISTTGTVTANATGDGYAIYIANWRNLTISNGTIHLSNADTPGNMIYIQNFDKRFEMTGGTVSYNGGTPPVLTSLSPATGTHDTEVILSGSNLTETTHVSVNRKESRSFTVDNNNRLTFITPSSPAGSGNILVETAGGAACLANGFTYTNTSYRLTILSTGSASGFNVGFIDTEPGTITKPGDPAPVVDIFGGVYVFNGKWYKDNSCTTEWDFDTDVVDKDMVIYAGYEALPAMTPADGAVDVALTETVTAEYADWYTVVANDLSGITLSPDPGNVSASLAGNKLTIAHDNFAPNTRYTVTIPAGTTNENKFLAIVWSFTTAPTSGIDNVNQGGIQIYPNVITDYFHIKGITRPASVSVYTLYGEMVMQREAQAEENISAGNLPSGVYLIAVEGKAFKVIKK